MKQVGLNEFLAKVRARKATLAREGSLLDDDICRSSGTRRTANKRTLLDNAKTRAEAVGVKPISSNH